MGRPVKMRVGEGRNMHEISRQAAIEAGVTDEIAADLLRSVINIMADTLADGGWMDLRGLGIFEVVYKKPRMVTNMQTRPATRFMVPAKSVVMFRPSSELRERVKMLVDRKAEHKKRPAPPQCFSKKA
jgi:integration host factor subunit beta